MSVISSCPQLIHFMKPRYISPSNSINVGKSNNQHYLIKYVSYGMGDADRHPVRNMLSCDDGMKKKSQK